MNVKKGIIIAIVIAIIGVGGFIAYNQILGQVVTDAKEIETTTIEDNQTKIILNGTVETKQSETFNYDYETYGRHISTPVTLGKYVNKGDIIVESSKKDYKAPFNGYITELNVDAAYAQAKEADKDEVAIVKPEVLYTIVSNEYFIDTKVTEYEIARLPKKQKITYSIRAKDADVYYGASTRLLSSAPLVDGSAAGQTKSDITSYALTLNMLEGKDKARVGNHVTIKIEDSEPTPLIIPEKLTVKEDGKVFVYTYKEDKGIGIGSSIKLEIKGKSVATGFQVESGLVAGEQVITTEVESLSNGGLVFKK
ncbi:MAG: hypothetical protein ACRC6X_03695 [Culicoidibacterales bacterium]